jgi:asparagine synthase (glutamine-hydrolysing)
MSDVPVGTFLSGGLDSSIVAALMRNHVDVLHTFSVGAEGSPDLKAARVVARHLGTIHHEYELTAREVREQLPRILFHLESFDQDLVRSAIPCYFVSRLAADQVKVILTGEGADELFAGYTYYEDFAHDHDTLEAELDRSLASMHNINLQRVDRMTMAHSIEGRVPFLDLQVIKTASSIPVHMKLKRKHERTCEKWILRRAVEDLLPPEIVWRKKEQFDDGSGTPDLIRDELDYFLPHARAGRYGARRPSARLRSHEETVYHHLLASQLTNPEPVLHNVARWAERPRNRSDIRDSQTF